MRKRVNLRDTVGNNTRHAVSNAYSVVDVFKGLSGSATAGLTLLLLGGTVEAKVR